MSWPRHDGSSPSAEARLEAPPPEIGNVVSAEASLGGRTVMGLVSAAALPGVATAISAGVGLRSLPAAFVGAAVAAVVGLAAAWLLRPSSRTFVGDRGAARLVRRGWFERREFADFGQIRDLRRIANKVTVHGTHVATEYEYRFVGDAERTLLSMRWEVEERSGSRSPESLAEESFARAAERQWQRTRTNG